MEMETDVEENLRKVAGSGTVDYASWPLLLETVVSQITKIAHEEFPIPRIPQPATAPPPPPEPRFLAPLPPSSEPAEPSLSPSNPPVNNTNSPNDSSGPSSQENNKENATPLRSSTPSSATAARDPVSAVELEPGTLPTQITAMLAEITGVLKETFHTYPPHTIQRLAQLVLEPRKHYRSLPSYLHAVDRVVHVTSGNNNYPLPPAVPDMSHMHINGATEAIGAHENNCEQQPDQSTHTGWTSNNSGGVAIGSDEALGGALLTPIPWLARRAANGGDGGSESGESSTLGSEAGGTPLAVSQSPGSNSSPGTSAGPQQRKGRQFEMQVRTESTETIDGPNGMGSIETVSVSINGISSMSAAQQQRVITQGELIRQEQRAGVVPVSQLARSGPVMVTSSSSGSSTGSGEGADTAMGEGKGDKEGADGETCKDTGSEKSDEDMADEEEAPHARGPDLIGAADMGPQKVGNASTFSITHAGIMEVRGIDVEAAVGRKLESQPPPIQSRGEGYAASDDSDDAVVLTPASSEVESSTSGQPVQEAIQDDVGKDASLQEGEELEANELLPAMETTMSTALSARPSPVKREAEDDNLEAESESKRFKTSILNEEMTGVNVPRHADTAVLEPAVGNEVKAEAEPQLESTREAGKIAGGETTVPDDQPVELAGAEVKTGPTAELDTTPAADEGSIEVTEPKHDATQPNPAELTD